MVIGALGRAGLPRRHEGAGCEDEHRDGEGAEQELAGYIRCSKQKDNGKDHAYAGNSGKEFHGCSLFLQTHCHWKTTRLGLSP